MKLDTADRSLVRIYSNHQSSADLAAVYLGERLKGTNTRKVIDLVGGEIGRYEALDSRIQQ